MSQDGYTLVDTLAALAILGMAMGGVMTGGALLTRAQVNTDGTVARAMGLKRASVALDDLLGQAGPFRSRDSNFTGSPQAFDFACAAGRCGAQLEQTDGRLTLRFARASGQTEIVPLRGVDAAHFVYVGGLVSNQTWPHATARPERLRQLALLEDTDQKPLVQVMLAVDQPLTCAFDTVSQDCR